MVSRLWTLIKKFFKPSRDFVIQLFRPFGVIKYHKMSFFLWLMFTLLGGLIGVIVSIARNVLFEDHYSLLQAIYIESANGAFYTYSIAVVAAVLSSVFIVFSENKNLSFRRYQIPLISFSIFLLLFGGVFYALSKKTSINLNELPDTEVIKVEWKQLTIFVLSVLFSIYSFCVCRLDEHSEVFSDISDDRLRNVLPGEDGKEMKEDTTN